MCAIPAFAHGSPSRALKRKGSQSSHPAVNWYTRTGTLLSPLLASHRSQLQHLTPAPTPLLASTNVLQSLPVIRPSQSDHSITIVRSFVNENAHLLDVSNMGNTRMNELCSL